MRIIAGAWRGRTLTAPPGTGTRPTADRLRQALFDMLLHAPWGGRDSIVGVQVLDVFAGTEVLALDVLAVSRGKPAGLVFLDPPYGRALIPPALSRLRAAGRLLSGALVVAETAQGEPPLSAEPIQALDERTHGKGRLTIWREP